MEQPLADRYLEVVKRSVAGLLHREAYALRPWEFEAGRQRVAGRIAARVATLAGSLSGQRLLTVRALEPDAPAGHWTLAAETMIGKTRLDHLQECVDTVLAEGVPGDVIEAGCWRGGAGILMRAILEARGDRERRVWLADSFAGLPPGGEHDGEFRLERYEELAVPRAEVEAAFERYGLLDERVRFVEGWFAETLPGLTEERWAIVRLDGDLYDSTRDSLTHLYPQLQPGGFLVVDDYALLAGCRRAVDEFRAAHAITEPIERIDAQAVFWRRGR